jgi:formylglycine-generating enzyme required for sulfatase activity
MPAILSRTACLAAALALLAFCLDWRLEAADSQESVDLTVSEQRPSFTNSVGMRFVYVKPGRFMMGTTKAERDAVLVALKGRAEQIENEAPRHQVTITKGFYVGIYEVTQSQYKQVTGVNPSEFSRTGSNRGKVQDVKDADLEHFPVENVTWNDAQAFLQKLGDLPAEKGRGRVYRLPTEAEWEYCCRAGSDEEPFTFAKPSKSISSKQANFDGKFPFGGGEAGIDRGRTCKVGSFAPNPWGLYDMHGNLWEMTADWYDANAYSQKNRVDPKGPQTGTHRVIRGGSWASNGEGCRSGYRRHDFTPNTRGWNYGFRAVCVVR